ncbi:MAG: maleylpyruvate isomerase N-terminal domain-containing protein, partial [Chloroflexi bacterium]|nr:maleylpyruvate isomerase N-terminal domain-containing protein [Chloroflexota bacterium]
MQPLEPIWIVDLLPDVHNELLALLRGLPVDAWDRPTAAIPWTVRDVVAHLLDTDIRRLTFQRDGLPPLRPETPINSYQDLVTFINQLNAEWVRAARRISPSLLIDFHAIVGPQVHQFFKSLDPFAPSPGGVAWAGEQRSPNWFDIAREYTEKWHHQQHIRDAVGAPGLTSRHFLHPALDTFLRGLPYTYRDVQAPAGTLLALEITGNAGDEWALMRQEARWQLYHGHADDTAARVRMDQDTAWRLFTKGITPAQARMRAQIGGDEALGARLLNL